MNASIKASSIPRCSRESFGAKSNVPSHSFGQERWVACRRRESVWWYRWGTHRARLVKISTSQRKRERKIRERRRPILRVVRLINGLLREFAIYYLAARQQPANPTVSLGTEWNDEKTINYFLFGFLWLVFVPYPLKDEEAQTERCVVGRRSSAAHVGRSELQLWHRSNKVLHRILKLLRTENRNEINNLRAAIRTPAFCQTSDRFPSLFCRPLPSFCDVEDDDRAEIVRHFDLWWFLVTHFAQQLPIRHKMRWANTPDA